ncbi:MULTISPECIES: MaoC family dehydratase [Mucilaginibacter]|jgi:acyl dehydratase|uniref:MaoC family dehydratase n=1 Tax=Mucilaginibacter ginsenosidivorax TaxID=862126 RepID=A0A5B8W136_9SPHI|nr:MULTISPECIES: MaoC family dehydratase [Mucilaginibacter]QEC77527.1 MaoC family dehydratase [Mucilaginibacter ginsenosidivorax]WDF78204.1 MaoC family dehydratase [Mucilaginibacter sp. KACC 22773]
MLTINNFAEFEAQIGNELGVSSWYKITQEQINKFADATLDHQWIHTDPERAKTESQFGATIAHGYLTLSLVPYLWKEIVKVENLKMEINYGIENFRFGQAVLVDSEVRLKVKLGGLVNLRGPIKATMITTLEIKDQKKPAFTGEIVFVYHFNA